MRRLQKKRRLRVEKLLEFDKISLEFLDLSRTCDPESEEMLSPEQKKAVDEYKNVLKLSMNFAKKKRCEGHGDNTWKCKPGVPYSLR